MSNVFKIAIVGSGPAGLSAAASNRRRAVLLERSWTYKIGTPPETASANACAVRRDGTGVSRACAERVVG